MSLATVDSFADLWLLSKQQRRERVLAVIEVVKPYSVYVDESIQYELPNNQGEKLYAVTAYVATFERWLQLEKQWQDILKSYGSPPFHFTDFMSRKGDYICLEWPAPRKLRRNEVESVA